MGFIKEKMKPLQVTKKRFSVCLSVGILSLTLAWLTVIVDPNMIIARYIGRVENDTKVHKAFQKTIVPVHMSAYILNVTNADRFQSGLDHKLKVEEIGPFTYQEWRRNDDLAIDHEKHIMKYAPKIWTKFIPEASVADPKDINVTMPNIAMLTFGSKMSSTFVSRMGFNLMAAKLKSKAFVTVNAEEYFWGYEDPIIKLGNSLLPGWIHFDKLGVMDRLYDKNLNQVFEVSGNSNEKFMIKTVNGSEGLDMWGYKDENERSICNSFTDSYEGVGYPTDMTPDRTIRIYRNTMCRIVDLEFFGFKTTDYGVKGLEYKISKRSFKIDNRTKCMCKLGVCQEGISDMSPCFYGLPLVLSNAHFLHADPSLYSRIDGIKPDEVRHGSSFVIDPKIGIAMETVFWTQVNMKLDDLNYNSEIRSFSNMVIPLIIVKIKQQKLFEDQWDAIKMFYFVGPKILLALQIILVLISIGCLSYSVLLLYWNWNYSRSKENKVIRENGKMASDPLIR